MLKSALIALVAMMGLQANAATDFRAEVVNLSQSLAAPVDVMDLINWTVGDNADYTVKGGILNGTLHTVVREATPEGYWLQQDMDLGFMGKQKVEVLYDKRTGQVLQLLVNGEKQTPPDPNDMEVVEQKHDSVTVPKGTFNCVYVKIHDKKQNQTSEVWVNPDLIPVGGMIKTLAPSQLGVITIELTNFRKQ